jgi:tyrosine-protein kinase Etk/Wzc
MTENTSPHNSIIAGSDPQSKHDVPDDDEISLLDLLQVVADNLRLLVLTPLLAGLLALGYGFTITPTFTATTNFFPPQQQQSGAAALLASLGGMGGLVGAASALKNPADQYVAFLKSRSLQDAVVDRFMLMDRLKIKFRHDARGVVEGSVQISSSRDGLITINASDKDPAFAAQLANAHVEELSKLLSRLAITEAQQRRLFFEKQLANSKDNLAKADQALKASGVNSNALKANPIATVEALARLKAGIAAQEIKLGSMRGYLTESAPDFKQAQTELAAMRNQMARAEKEELASDTNSGDGDYIAKYRNFKYHETLFELFTKQYELARIDESREGAVISVLDTAQPPERKSKPDKAKIAIMTSLVVGFALLIFVFGRHTLRRASDSPETNQKMFRLRKAVLRAINRD